MAVVRRRGRRGSASLRRVLQPVVRCWRDAGVCTSGEVISIPVAAPAVVDSLVLRWNACRSPECGTLSGMRNRRGSVNTADWHFGGCEAVDDTMHYVVEGCQTQLLANVNSGSCSLYVVVRPSVACRLSVTFVHPTQAIEIFGNVSIYTVYAIWYVGHL